MGFIAFQLQAFFTFKSSPVYVLFAFSGVS